MLRLRDASSRASTVHVALGSITQRFAGRPSAIGPPWAPARIAGLEPVHGGPVAEGRPANLCVIDPAAVWVVEAERLASRSRNTPYAGRKLTGRVRHTLLRGEPVVVDGEAQR